MMFDSFSLKRRPDQTSYNLNKIVKKLEGMENTIRVVSKDRKGVIIIGEQPDRTFGIKQYKVKGDRLELIKEVL